MSYIFLVTFETKDQMQKAEGDIVSGHKWRNDISRRREECYRSMSRDGVSEREIEERLKKDVQFESLHDKTVRNISDAVQSIALAGELSISYSDQVNGKYFLIVRMKRNYGDFFTSYGGVCQVLFSP